jgi:hypothetical protein
VGSGEEAGDNIGARRVPNAAAVLQGAGAISAGATLLGRGPGVESRTGLQKVGADFRTRAAPRPCAAALRGGAFGVLSGKA